MNPYRERIRCLLASLLLLAGTKSGTAEQLFFAKGRTIIPYETTTGVLGAPVSIQGLDSIQALDFRPSDGRLFALGLEPGNGLPGVFAIDPITGAAAPVGEPLTEFKGSTPWSIAFNPSNDQLRIVSQSGANLIFDTFTGKRLREYPSIEVLGIGYGGGSEPTLYGLKGSSLVIVNEADGSLSTVGSIGHIALALPQGFGFGVSRKSGKAYGYFDTPFGQIDGELYEIDLKTAKARLLRTSGIWIPSLAVAPSQEIPVSGLYQIDGGRFQVCCGLLGSIEIPLPNKEQRYIALSVVPDGGTASMTVLGEDEKTVFALEGGGLRDDFVYQFQNGVMSLHSLVFDSPPALNLHQSSYAYSVQFTDTGLSLRGSVRVPCVFCADFPEDFSHSDLTATLVISAPLIQSFRRSKDTVKFTFKGEPGYDYFVEYSKTLPAIQWQVLTQFRSKLFAIEPEVIDTISDDSMRAYRIRKQPCLCR